MPNITLSMPDDLLKKGRLYAQARGTSLNALVRSLLTDTVSEPSDSIDGIMARLEQSPGNSGGWKFNREELQR